MKHLVRTTPLSVESIRPSDALKRFHAAAIRDSKMLREGLLASECPACGGDSVPAFEREGFWYRECRRCESVFAAPRPSVDAVSRFYATTEAGRLRTAYFQAAGQERLNHVVRSRVDWVANYVAGARPDNVRLLDVGTLYPSFLAELRNQGVAGACDSLDPPEGLEADARAAGAQVGTRPTIASVDVVTAFEQLEHQSDPGAFLRRLKGVLKPGGWLFATTRSISGLDLQVLWDKAPYIFVPEHLNLLSVEGLTTLFEAAGFAIVELSTPGQLDVELIERSAQDFDIPLPRMLRYLFRHRGDECRADLQELLQRHRLSSHVRIAARVPTA